MDAIIKIENIVNYKINMSHYEKYLNDKIEPLKKIIYNYPKKVVLDVIISEVEDNLSLSFLISLISNPVYIHGLGNNIFSLTDQLVDCLIHQVKDQIKKEKHSYRSHRKIKQQKDFKNLLPALLQYKEYNDYAAFARIFEVAIPNLKDFIKRINKTDNQHIDVDEFINELYLYVYNHFDKRPSDESSFNEWIFTLSYQLLKKKHEVGNQEKYLSIESLEDKEYQYLSENYSVDADGELTFIDEFDDPSYWTNSADVHQIIEEELIYDQYEIEDQNKFLNDLNLHVLEILSDLSLEDRITYDLYFIEGLKENEIARIKKSRTEEVRKTINVIIATFCIEN
ncbi:MAG: hypothetical protein ACOCWG_04390, partial [bacterium]